VRGKVAVAASGAASVLALKFGIAGVLAVLAVGAVVQRVRGTETAMTPHVVTVAPSEPASTPTASFEATPPITGPSEAIEMAPAPMRRAPVAVVETTEEPDDLAREVALIDRAMAALRKGDAARALATIKLHAAETAGAGQLAEDAAAIEIEALCRLHSPSVAAKLDAFDARYPHSAQRSRLTTRCQD